MKEDEKKEKKMYREFTVTPGIAGFKVKIGCSEVCFGDAESLGRAISVYLNDPQGVEKEFVNADQRIGAVPQAEAPGYAPMGYGTGGSDMSPIGQAPYAGAAVTFNTTSTQV